MNEHLLAADKVRGPGETWEEYYRRISPRTDMAESLLFNNREAATDHGGKSAVEAVSRKVMPPSKLDGETWDEYYKRCASAK